MDGEMKNEHLKIEAGHRFEHRAGGQTVGNPCPSVKVTHMPTGIIAFCESERSQSRNLRGCKAMIEYGLAEIEWKDESNRHRTGDSAV